MRYLILLHIILFCFLVSSVDAKIDKYKKGDLISGEIKLNKNCYPSQLQKDWIEDLLDRGYYAVVCKGYDECIETLENYLLNDRTNETKEIN